MGSGKIKSKVETGTKEPKRFREQAGSFRSRKSVEEKMDDMDKIIKDFSNKISRMELDQAKPDPFARKDFRRNPNSQTQQKQVKNEDQKIQAPFKLENFIGDDIQNYEGLEEDVKKLSDEYHEPHLTR